MAEIDLGPVEGPKGTSMRFRGDWNGIAEYRNDEMFVDCVAYDNGLWICKATCSAQMPADGSEYWSFACAGMTGPQGDKGDKGDKGDTPDLQDMGINASAQEINQLTGIAGNAQEQLTSVQTKVNTLDVSMTGLAGRSPYVKTVGVDSGKVSNLGFRTSVGRFTVMLVGNAGGDGTIFLLIPLNAASLTMIGSSMTVTGVTSLGSQGGFTATLVREGTDWYRLKIRGYSTLMLSVVTFYTPEGVEIQYASQADG